MAKDLNEYDAITKAVQHDIDGARTGRGDEMKKAFHGDTTIFGYAGPEFMAGPIQALFDWDENGPATDIHVRITSIDLANTVATPRMEIDNWTSDWYTDLFVLLKVDGQWKIMNKVFHWHCADP